MIVNRLWTTWVFLWLAQALKSKTAQDWMAREMQHTSRQRATIIYGMIKRMWHHAPLQRVSGTMQIFAWKDGSSLKLFQLANQLHHLCTIQLPDLIMLHVK
jgi:hypothetical protein